jgi:hypothetical protein
MLTLWDLLDPLLSKLLVPPPDRTPVVKVRPLKPAAAHPLPLRPASVQAAQPTQLQAPAHPANRPRRTSKADADGDVKTDASMQAKYDAVVQRLLQEHNIRVRKWRKSMSGIAWYVTYRDGKRVNLIESPRPRGPMSAAVFLHEIGHHAIGFNVYKPRCLEEYHAWRWSLEAMEKNGLNITNAVKLRMHRSLWYAVEKARRRGIKQIPAELVPFMEKPSFARRRRR